MDAINRLPEEEPKWEMDDLIVRGDAIDAMTDENIIRNLDSVHDCALNRIKRSMMRILAGLPSAQPEPISEAYAKAVRTWLVDYQVRCAELKGRYTPYEILGWIVSDWRKENEIW